MKDKVYPRYLQFLKNKGLTTQKLLFDESSIISPNKKTQNIDESFYENGYTVVENIDSPEKAGTYLENFISNIDSNKYRLFKQFESRVQLAKLDQIPVCDDIVHTTFQALHFDMGQPFFSKSLQVMYLFIGLYCPHETKNATAKTRVVNIGQLLSQKNWEERKTIEKNLLDYVKKHGDGWTEPTKVNTYRISCFARVIDAVTKRYELKDWINKTTGQWFNADDTQDGMLRMKLEYDYLMKSGLDVGKVEKQIALKPGQLLIIDNMRNVHGRVGKRKSKELWQFLYGIKSASPEDIDASKNSLVSQFVAK